MRPMRILARTAGRAAIRIAVTGAVFCAAPAAFAQTPALAPASPPTGIWELHDVAAWIVRDLVANQEEQQ